MIITLRLWSQFFFLLYCFMGKSSKGHLLLLVYLQWVLIYGELCWKSVCATQVYLNSVTALRMPFPFWLPVVTEKLSKLFAVSVYVVKLDIYDIIKHYLKANKRRLYRQNGILWVKERNTTHRYIFLLGCRFSYLFFNLLFLFEKLGWQVLCSYFHSNICIVSSEWWKIE